MGTVLFLVDTVLSLLVPYVAYLLAESVHASGVIAVVVAGLLLGHKAPIIQTAPSRITERTTWGSIAFLLENSVFLLIGLQAHWIIDGIAQADITWPMVALICVATLVTVIAVRMVWVLATQPLVLRRRRPDAPVWPSGVIIGWAGMRGVVAGTLFIQGLTLPWLTRRLDVPAPDPALDALARATVLEQAGKAGLARLDEPDADDPHGVTELVRKRIEERNFAAWERLGTTGGQESPSELYARVRLEMLAAERAQVLEVRSSGELPSEVVSEVLTLLDVEETIVAGSAERSDEVRSAGVRLGDAHGYADLEAHPCGETPVDAVCQGCVDEGATWVALRRCLDCGHVGCCDSSAGRHATAHFRATRHPVMQSAQPGELWRWCYVHHLTG